VVNDSSYQRLAIDILKQAAKDYQKKKHKSEVGKFLNSTWCEDLCEIAGLPYLNYVQMVRSGCKLKNTKVRKGVCI